MIHKGSSGKIDKLPIFRINKLIQRWFVDCRLWAV